MKKFVNSLAAAAVLTTTVPADETKVPAQVVETGNKVGLIVRNNSLGLGADLGKAYIEATGNVKTGDEYGVGGAYGFDNGLVLGGSFAEKNHVGNQKGVGLGYVKDFNEEAYIGVAGKYTKFYADNAYANSDSYKAQVLAGYKITEDLYAEAGAGLKTFKAEGYDRETSAELTLGVNFVQPDYSIKVAGTVNKFDENVMVNLIVPISGKNSTSSLSVGQDTIKKYIADSSFDDEIVKVKKTPTTPETPNTAPTISNISFIDNNGNSITQYDTISLSATIADENLATTTWQVIERSTSSVNGGNGTILASGTGQFTGYDYTIGNVQGGQLTVELSVTDQQGSNTSVNLIDTPIQ